MTKDISQETRIDACKQTLLAFINECYQHNKLYYCNNDDNEKQQNMLRIMKTYTTYRRSYECGYILDSAKDIKEIATVDFISNRKVRILTKKNRSTVSACEFYMVNKKQGWMIESFSRNRGTNSFDVIFSA